MKTLPSACAIVSSLSLFALPQDPHVVSGEVLVQMQPEQLQITTSDRAILNWQGFSIGQNEKVQFVQPSSRSAVLNRVKGSGASQILGQLQANGKVYLINPHGVIFGKDAVIQTSAFLASTHDLLDQDFLEDREMLFKGDSKEAIINYGTIQAFDGDVTLIGRIIDNKGTLQAENGSVSLAAGQEIILKPESTPALTIRPSLEADGVITHAGKIEALVAELQAEGHPHIYAINLTGAVQALNPVPQNGKIYLRADSISISAEAKLEAPQGSIEIRQAETSPPRPLVNLGTLDVSGPQGGTIQIETLKILNSGKILAEGTERNGGTIQIDAHEIYSETTRGILSTTGKENGGMIHLHAGTSLFTSGTYTSQGTQGGNIQLAAPSLTLVSAQLDVSGEAQGGEILIGKAETQLTDIRGDTRLVANATTSGSGGKISIWSDEKTICYGSSQANAGPQGGDGGKVEISGEGEFFCGAILSAAATHGTPGEVLIDPKNIVIDAVLGIYPQYEFIDPHLGSGTGFGSAVKALSSGNVAITKPHDNFAASSAGAVYLYNGLTAALISTITGSQVNDQVGSGGITTLTGNGNYVIVSSNWKNGGNANAGAATWGSGITGIGGTVSSTNSLVGTTANDRVGSGGITALPNGNYVVTSASWSNVGASSAGAVTFGNGATGIFGTVSPSNSLVGTVGGDAVGSNGVILLTNGNYVVNSSVWNTIGLGAITWGSGTSGVSGNVSGTNSLIGVSTLDEVGSGGVVALTNGNYVVKSPNWHNGAAANAGAATWGNGTTGTTGTVGPANSIVGTSANDTVGNAGVTVFTNGNYVVNSSFWKNGAATHAGAATWGNGTTGTAGTVSPVNSIVGTSTNDLIGGSSSIALTNGNYVVVSPSWRNGAAMEAGAVTWGNGATGTFGTVTAANSLVGTSAFDEVGTNFTIALTNGNYVVTSALWSNGGVTSAGAVTWGNGATGTSGTVTPSNSLVGTLANDFVGVGGATALSNGNYVVNSYLWNNGATTQVGAVTWANGATGSSGPVTLANSLVGTSAGDQVGLSSIALSNGNFVIRSPFWANGSATHAGAVTWGNGTTGIIGIVSNANSLIGSTTNDEIGVSNITALKNGNYVVNSPPWSNGGAASAGAVTFGNGTTGISGTVGPTNSLVGTTAGDSVGLTGIALLSNSNYIVLSSSWNSPTAAGAGAATLGSGTVGISGTVTVQNSITGQAANSGLSSTVQQDNVNQTWIITFITEQKVRAGIFTPDQMTFLRAEAQTMTIPPSFVVNTLNTGTAVTLQASNDFTLSSPLISNPGGGNLTLRAGRSLFLNSNITTGDGSLTAIANDLLSSGVVDADRDPGNAVLSVGNAVTIDVGQGALTLSLLNGAGKTNAGSGDLTIGNGATLQSSGSAPMSLTTQTTNITVGDTTSMHNTGAGSVSLTAPQGGVTFGNTDILQTAGGDLIVTAGMGNLTSGNGTTFQSTGTGAVTLTSPLGPITFGTTGLVQTVNGTLTVTAGMGNLTSGNGTTFQSTGTGAVTLTSPLGPITFGTTGLVQTVNGTLTVTAGMGNLTSGDNTTFQSTGTGAVNLTAPLNTITLGNNDLIQTHNGNITLTAGLDLIGINPLTMQVTGTGQLVLICDNLFPTSPGFGNGNVTLPLATLNTAGGKLLIYTSQRPLNSVPSTINGVPFVPGPVSVNTLTEKWGVYFPNSSGIPFTIFYKVPLAFPIVIPPTILQNGLHAIITATVEPFWIWRINPWYDDAYLSVDKYPPFLTPKDLRLRLPSLVKLNEPVAQLKGTSQREEETQNVPNTAQ